MRLASVFWLFVGLLAPAGWCASALAGETLPCLGYVVVDSAPVRCGPGNSCYITGDLARGEKVEVHRRERGGWLAVRPPTGSFSWVAARLITVTERDLGEVTAEDAVAWVGCGAGERVNHRWQVKLQRGEQVEVRGQAELAPFTGSTEETYYRIAPPAGEFRWVLGKHIADEPAWLNPGEPPGERVRVADLQIRPTASGQAEVRPAGHNAPEAKRTPQQAAKLAGKTTAQRLSNLPKAPPKESQPSGSGETPIPPLPPVPPLPSAPALSPIPEDEPAATPESQPATPPAPATSAAPNDGEAKLPDAQPKIEEAAEVDLGELEVQLSLMVALDSDLWQLPPLREQAQRVVAKSRQATERSRARLLLQRIREFESLQQRLAAAESGELPSATPHSAVPPTAGKLSSGGLAAEAGVTPLYDGEGTLMPVRSLRKDVPPYALLDKDGDILCYVTPAPGLNLHRYLRQDVGLLGQRGFAAPLQAQHLTAHRVVSLARHRR